MADVKISALPAASVPLAGTEVVPLVQGGVTKKVPINDLTAGRAIQAASAVISENAATPAVRINQLGTGDALVVEDSTNPDQTPFVINSVGRVINGYPSVIATRNYNNSAVPESKYQQHGTSQNDTTMAVFNWGSSTGSPANLILNKSISNAIDTRAALASLGTDIGSVSFNGDDGSNFIPAAAILCELDSTPGLNDMPGRLILMTTPDGAAVPVERFRISADGRFTLGGAVSTNSRLLFTATITGGTTAYGYQNNLTVDPTGVTSGAIGTHMNIAVSDIAATLPYLRHYSARQSTFGENARVTDQFGYFVDGTLIGAANNYGVYSNISNATQRTIAEVSRASNVVTITTTAAHGFTPGQRVTVAATTNTSLNGTFTITSVPSTTTFTYAQAGVDIGAVADTGSVNSSGRWNIFANGTAPNYFAGDMRLDKTVTAAGTTGAQTINKNTGSVNFAAAATSVVVTNSRVTADSIIIATVGTNDATMKSVAAVAAAGSFTLIANAAATAETRVNFLITN
jgi:hypothetical protein